MQRRSFLRLFAGSGAAAAAAAFGLTQRPERGLRAQTALVKPGRLKAQSLSSLEPAVLNEPVRPASGLTYTVGTAVEPRTTLTYINGLDQATREKTYFLANGVWNDGDAYRCVGRHEGLGMARDETCLFGCEPERTRSEG